MASIVIKERNSVNVFDALSTYIDGNIAEIEFLYKIKGNANSL